jgi:hypothetical protein
MERLKRLFIIMILVTFSTNAYAYTSVNLCKCDNPSKVTSVEMPCHGVKQAENSTSEKNKTSKCKKCACGHCNVTSQSSIINPNNAYSYHLQDTLSIIYSDNFASSIFYAIDYPPKHIS